MWSIQVYDMHQLRGKRQVQHAFGEAVSTCFRELHRREQAAWQSRSKAHFSGEGDCCQLGGKEKRHLREEKQAREVQTAKQFEARHKAEYKIRQVKNEACSLVFTYTLHFYSVFILHVPSGL